MIYLSLGSNLGHRLNNLRAAVDLLQRQGCWRQEKTSVIFETTALLPPQAPAHWNKPYLNMVIGGTTDLAPLAFLGVLKDIEGILGRDTTVPRWGPRVIDMDILLWPDHTISTPQLTLPHPGLEDRIFLHHLLASLGVDSWHDLPPQAYGRTFCLGPALMGIVNVTPDSFSDGGKFFHVDQAVQHVYDLMAQGASVVDIGAQSTRPGAAIQGPAEEWSRLEPVLQAIAPAMAQGTLVVSLDTFWPQVVQKILPQYAVAWINNQKGLFDEATLACIAQAGVKYGAMHALSVPPGPEARLPVHDHPMVAVHAWGEALVDHLLAQGITQENIVLDPGIGFGKSAHQNFQLMSAAAVLRTLGVKVLVGHSRKSFIGTFSAAPAPERDVETLAVSLALKNKVDYLRVHNVQDHHRALVAQAMVEGL